MAVFQLRAFLLVVFLTACSASAPAPMIGRSSYGAASVDRVEDMGSAAAGLANVALSCSADTVRFCPPRGCDANNPGFDRAAPLAITTPNPGEQVGRFCNGQDCQPAFFRNFRAREGAMVGDLWTGQNWTRPEGTLEIASSRARFRLNKPASDGVLVWRGVCQAAGS